MDEKARIEKIIETERMTATQFAEEIGIQGSTMSHILNGRNRPSLDVLKRILNRFRMINSDWLILGIGSMYRPTSHSQQPLLFDIKPEIPSESDNYAEKNEEKLVCNLNENRKTSTTSPIMPAAVEQKPAKTITKVVVFYSDNTFDEILR